jgi:hypothetical protein
MLRVTAAMKRVSSGSPALTLQAAQCMLLLLVSAMVDQVAAAAAPGGYKPAAAQALAAQHPQYTLQDAPTAAKLKLLSPNLDSASTNLRHSSSSSSRRLQAGEQLQQQALQPSLPEALLAKGFKGLAPAVLRNWRRLADKLGSPGAKAAQGP